MLVALIVFAIAALVLPSVTRMLRTRAFLVAAAVPAAVFVFTLSQGPAVLGGDTPVESVSWIPALHLDVAARMDVLAWVLALVVTGVGALVLAYCVRYFDADDPRLGRFAAFFVAFAGTMYGLVVADDLYVLFVFWEATSVFSYLLIGHFTERRESRAAALQAFIVTTAGGLAMLVGLVMLAVASGTTSLARLLADPPTGGLVTVAVLLVLVGALSKSAQVPFHFWLPAAMAAPTPVSAYLHAAAMVKAGVYVVARFAPAFALVPGWRPLLITVGVVTMLVGGWRALRQSDLKLLLAYGTVSQLGLLTIALGYGTAALAGAGLALLLAHALFKSTLFLVVGVVDRCAGTRDVRRLSGLSRSSPTLLAVSILAAAAMAGVPPTLGFVAKEGVLAALVGDVGAGSAPAVAALIGVCVGSVLTVAYTARFVWGAFASKPGVPAVTYTRRGWSMYVAPVLLSVVGLALGVATGALIGVFGGYAATFGGSAPDLALWHGLSPALLLSVLVFALAAGGFWCRAALRRLVARVPAWLDTGRAYRVSMRALDRVAVRVTAATQSGSLTAYVGTILVVWAAGVAAVVAWAPRWRPSVVLWDQAAQVPIVVVMIVSALAVTRASRRFAAAVLLGVTGYGLAALFALRGAPDLALTQLLVESATLIAFVLVLRRLPPALGHQHGSVHRRLRALLAAAVGALMAVVAVVAAGARTAAPVSVRFGDFAAGRGHGDNIVNVTLVDIRGWDTMGEISVLVVAATGVASLIFITRRLGAAPRLARRPSRGLRARVHPLMEPEREAVGSDEHSDSSRRTWLFAGWTLEPRNRSIVLEVVVRLMFHSMIVVSIYLLLSGHDVPGGGFAGGLLAGLALVARYLAGGRYELGAAAPADAGLVLGSGLLLAAGTATAPLLFGLDALRSAWFETTLPVLGHLEFGSTTIFDLGVYLVVVGLILDVLRSLGAEVDRHIADELAPTAPLPVEPERSTR